MYFFRLIRPINLIIIALTMYSAMLFLRVFEHFFHHQLSLKPNQGWDFGLLIICTLLIAAAGNIINDYFDVRADRINKPKKLIVSKHIKRRWAIVLHWLLNVLAFGISIYLSVKNNTFWYVFIHLLTINTLWVYSAKLKRKPFIGNMTIAALTALVPIQCGIHIYYHSNIQLPNVINDSSALAYWIHDFVAHGNFIFILAFFAFTTNLSREIIKDIEDVPGDLELGAKTLPIAYGVKKAKWMASIPIFISPIVFFAFITFHQNGHTTNILENTKLFAPILLSFVASFIALSILVKADKKKQFKRADLFLKIAMLSGILLPFYWLILFK